MEERSGEGVKEGVEKGWRRGVEKGLRKGWRRGGVGKEWQKAHMEQLHS